MRRLAYITAAVVVSIAVWTLPLFAQKQVQALPTDTLARYGPHVITAADFLERFELMPYPLKDNRTRIELTKQEFLQSLVAEKMLALEAQRLGFGQDTVSQEMQYSLQRLFTRDEVYKRDVTAHIRVTPEEMREGMGRYPWELRLIVYRRVSTKEGDILLKKQAISKNKEKTFETSRDMVFAPLDTMTVDFGELEPAAETIAFGLKIGECSSPFLWGRNDWRMVKLVDKYANPTYAKQSVPDQIAEVKKIVSRRQEDSLAARVFISFLGPQRAEADPALVRELADSLLHIIKSDSANHVKKNFFQIDVADLERLEEEIGPRLAQKMIATETGDLSLGAVINGLKYTTIVFPSLKPRTVFTIVNNNIKTVVQNELVAREGMKRNYQQSENVRHDVNVWMDSRRSRLLMKAVTDTVAVEDTKIDAAVKLNIRRKLLDERKQQTLNNYLGALGRKYNVTMDTAKLRSVSTTTTSMVTWRTIGFGGRILAVPMVVPQTQWIRGMLPEKTINQ